MTQENVVCLGDVVALPGPVIFRYRLSVVREAQARFEGPELCSRPALLARFCHRVVAGAAQEMMGAVYLDSRHRVVGYSIPYLGTLNRCCVEPRLILATGLLLNAASLVLFHNHPSGDPSPSAEDRAFTQRLEEAGEVVGVTLLDHLVLGEGGQWVSLLNHR